MFFDNKQVNIQIEPFKKIEEMLLFINSGNWYLLYYLPKDLRWMIKIY